MDDPKLFTTRELGFGVEPSNYRTTRRGRLVEFGIELFFFTPRTSRQRTTAAIMTYVYMPLEQARTLAAALDRAIRKAEARAQREAE